MKDQLRDKRLQIFFFLFIVGLVLWFGGPYIAIAGYPILANPIHRLLLLLGFSLFWGAFNLRANKNYFLSSLFIEMEELQNNLIETQKLLKNNMGKSLRWLQRFPAYLILGAPESGKTQLLTAANTNNASPIQEKYFDCWLINNTVFFDYTAKSTMAKTEQEAKLLWRQFLFSFKKLQSSLPLQGIIITISLASLESKQESLIVESLLEQLKESLLFFRKLPVTLLFTQGDHLSGFTDYFADLNQEERAQPFGFTFPRNTKRKKILELFNNQFDLLLKQLNQRLLLRLHQELNQQKRIRMKDLPLHLELMKNQCTRVIEKIINLPHLSLQGCYITSTQQTESSKTSLQKSIEHAFLINISAETAQYQYWQNKSFFIRDLFYQLFQKQDREPIEHDNRFKKIILIAMAVSIITPSVFWFFNYRETVAAIDAMQYALNTNPISTPAQNTYAFLPRLIALHKGLEKIDHPSSFFKLLELNHARDLRTTAQGAYQKILTTQFLPVLKNIVETSINANEQNPNNLYTSLKIYLMLKDPTHRNDNFIKQWFSNYWQQTLPSQSNEQTELLTQLTVVLQKKLTITTDDSVINNARNNLANVPLSQLCYAVLFDRYNQPVSLFKENNAMTVSNRNAIARLYIAKNIEKVYQDIPSACEEVINGNWILGTKQSASVDMNNLTDQVKNIYLNNYANAWQTLLNNVQINNPKNLNDIKTTFNTLASAHSPLSKLLKTLVENTAPNPKLDPFTLIVSSKFQTIDNFIKSNALLELTNSLAKLGDVFDNLKDDKHAFLFAKACMENNGENDPLSNLLLLSENTPQPLQSWLAPLGAQSWHLVLQASQAYINTVWQQAVLPQYHSKIDQRYPLFKNADTDISLTDFTAFFSAQGLLSEFFNNYLKPFVNTSHVYWVWKNVNNDHLAIPQTTLEMFIRADLIEKMFFTNNPAQPSIQFTLIPTALEPGVSDFQLNLEGQIIEFQTHRANQPVLLKWPGPVPNQVTLKFINTQGKPETITTTGPWAWFKILDRANLQTTLNNPRKFNIIFDLNGNSAQYELVSNDLINPFIKGIISVFRCPEQL